MRVRRVGVSRHIIRKAPADCCPLPVPYLPAEHPRPQRRQPLPHRPVEHRVADAHDDAAEDVGIHVEMRHDLLPSTRESCVVTSSRSASSAGARR